jgi:hypothetical protein
MRGDLSLRLRCRKCERLGLLWVGFGQAVGDARRVDQVTKSDQGG